MLAGTKARVAKAWCRLHLPDLLSCRQHPGVCGKDVTHTASHTKPVPGLKFHLQGLPTWAKNGCVSHILVLAELKTLKQGDFRVNRKKHLPSLFSLQRAGELQAVEGRCVTSAAVTGLQSKRWRNAFRCFLSVILHCLREKNVAAELENCRNWVKCFWPPTQSFSCCFHVKVNRYRVLWREQKGATVFAGSFLEARYLLTEHTERPVAVFPGCSYLLGDT